MTPDAGKRKSNIQLIVVWKEFSVIKKWKVVQILATPFEASFEFIKKPKEADRTDKGRASME